jgi:transposase
MTIAEAARREMVSEQSIGRWKADFLEAGKTALVAGKPGPSTREAQLEAEVADLTQALGEPRRRSCPTRCGVLDPRATNSRRTSRPWQLVSSICSLSDTSA